MLRAVLPSLVATALPAFAAPAPEISDTFRTITMAYAEGPKFLELTLKPEHADTLSAILKAVTKDEKN